MKPRTVVSLLLAVLLLGAVIGFLERDLPSSDERAELRDRALGLAEDTVDQVASIELRSGEALVQLVRSASTDGGERPWRVMDPATGTARRADGEAVDSFLESLVQLRVARRLDGEATPAPALGAAPVEISLRVSEGLDEGTDDGRSTGREVTLRLGDAVPLGGGHLAAHGGEVMVVEAGAELLAQARRPAAAWRDPRILAIERHAIDRIVIDRMVMDPIVMDPDRIDPEVKDQGTVSPLELVRVDVPGERFRVVRPDSDRADSDAVSALLTGLLALRAAAPGDLLGSRDEVTAAAADLAALAPERSIGIVVETGGGAVGDAGAKTIRLRLGDGRVQVTESVEDELGESRLATEVRDLEIASSDDLLGLVGMPASAWRSRDLFGVQVFDVDLVTIRDADGPLELERLDGIWRLGGSADPASPDTVADLLYPLLDLRALDWWLDEAREEPGRDVNEPLWTAEVARNPTAERPEGFTAQVTVFAEGTGGASAGRHPARVSGRAGVFELDATDVDEIVRRLAALREGRTPDASGSGTLDAGPAPDPNPTSNADSARDTPPGTPSP